MPVVDGDMPLVLRTAQTPPASDPGPGALSATQVDANWSMLKAAILVLAAEMLSTSSAEELTGPATTESGDFFILVKDGISYFALVDDLISDMSNPMTTAGDLIIGGTAGAPARLAAGTNGHVLTLVAGVPTWVAASAVESWEPVTISHDGADVAPVTGDTITVTFASGWTGTIAWLRAGAVIDGATSATYTLVEADEDLLIRPRISSLIFTAAGYTAGAAPGGGGGTAAFVQTNFVDTVYDTEEEVPFLAPTTSGNTAVVSVILANARSITSVVGSDAVSFGTAIFSEVFGDVTHHYFMRANAPALTSVTVTPDEGTGFITAVYEWAGLGTAPVLDVSDGANYGSNTSPWEFTVAPTVTGTALMTTMSLTLDGWPVGVSPMVAGPAAAGYNLWGYAALAASGSQTLEVDMTTDGTTPATRAGDRSWIVLRAGS